MLSLDKRQYLGRIITIREAEGIIASALAADPAEISNEAPHYHINPIISFVLEGNSVERIGRHTKPRSAGDSRFYRAGELHQVKIKRFPSRNINFELETHFLTKYEISENMIASAMERNVNAKPLFLRMYRELLITDMFTSPSIRILILNLIGEDRQFLPCRKPKWTEMLYELLNDRWSENLTLRDLSSTIKVHPITISKYFTKYFSCTLGAYMRRLRISKSISLIKTSNLSLTAIASECGFADQSHFTRNFKELTGHLPRDFKKL